ncbi:MAG: hypothetical protein IJV44_01735 [Prevotella sp.]|nr:hypothetical protein [Prevotella sp.]
MVDGNKLGILKSILDWSQAIKQKSVELQTQFIFEYSEEIRKGSISECDNVAYHLFNVWRILSDMTEECKTVEYYQKKR